MFMTPCYVGPRLGTPVIDDIQRAQQPESGVLWLLGNFGLACFAGCKTHPLVAAFSIIQRPEVC